MRSGRLSTPKAAVVRWAALVATLITLTTGYFATPAVGAAQLASGCDYALGFATLRSEIQRSTGTDPVGVCRENEYHALSGDGVQWTEKGLFVWRKATGWTGFTDGTDTWVAGPDGAAKRSNSERLAWESTGRPEAVAYLDAPSASLPPRSEVDEAIREVYVLHAAGGGSTVNLYFGDLGGTDLYAVSLYPDRGVVVPGKQPSIEVLRRFVVDNSDLLGDPRVSVGTWYNTDNGLTYLDVSATVADRQQAIELGKKYNQISIFDLATFEEIETGGTGEAIPNLPPALDRLPKWPASRS